MVFGPSSFFFSFPAIYTDFFKQVEERRKEALSRTSDDGSSLTEGTLHDVISRYSFMDLWPCSSKDLDHLSRQEVSLLLPSSWVSYGNESV